MSLNVNSRLVAVVALVCCVASSAQGSLTILNSLAGGNAYGGATYVNFDNLANFTTGSAGGSESGLTLSFVPDGQIVTGSASGLYAAPFLSGTNNLYFHPTTPPGADGTQYVTGGADPDAASAVLTFATGQQYLGILWGSVDDYNVLEFYDAGGLIGVVTGADVVANPNGDQGINGTSYVNIVSSTPFTKVIAKSDPSRYAFEFDNIAFGETAVPEAATIAVWSGLSLLGWVAYRRRAS